MPVRILDVEQQLLLLELEAPFEKRDVQLARRTMAKRWHPDVAPQGRQFEHERHLKAINEAADHDQGRKREQHDAAARPWAQRALRPGSDRQIRRMRPHQTSPNAHGPLRQPDRMARSTCSRFAGEQYRQGTPTLLGYAT